MFQSFLTLMHSHSLACPILRRAKKISSCGLHIFLDLGTRSLRPLSPPLAKELPALDLAITRAPIIVRVVPVIALLGPCPNSIAAACSQAQVRLARISSAADPTTLDSRPIGAAPIPIFHVPIVANFAPDLVPVTGNRGTSALDCLAQARAALSAVRGLHRNGSNVTAEAL